jgi:acyl-CoA synthetase (AMP-forming)/AMP-acid ligase II/acyl carrier protein
LKHHLVMTSEAATLQQALQRAAAWAPGKHITYVRGHGVESCISYADLLADTSALGGWLASQGIERGEPTIVTSSRNEHFVRAFWSSLFAGAVPVPLVVPASWNKASPTLDRFTNTSRLLGNPRVILDRPAIDDPHIPPHLRNRAVVLPRSRPDTPVATSAAAQDDTAFIQFSSGSTGEPKGVVLTHRNVMTNLAAIRAGVMATPADRAVSWMPLHHDFGLIGLLLGSISCPNDLVLIETAAFIRRPLLWLDMLHEHRATITVCPNFGQSLVLSRLEGKRAWDLSALRVIFNGAEPISARVMEAFCAALAPAGLHETAMFPVYGLAEATLAVTFSDLGTPPRIASCDRRSLRMGGRTREIDVQQPDAARVVSVGRPVQYCAVQIVDDDDRVVEQGTVGHVHVRGDNVTAGYFHDPQATATAFHNGWLRTGDLGFMRDGCLFITGRAKDVLFINGQNLYAHDIEQIVMQAPAAAGRRVAVCGWRDSDDASDRLLVFVATSHPDRDLATFRAIEEQVASVFGLRPHAMVPLVSSQFPRTTSGKLQRHVLRERFDRGEYDESVGRLAWALEHARLDARVGPGNDTERLVHRIWSRELGLKPGDVGIHDRFDYLGGTSLNALAITQAIEDESGIKLPSDVIQVRPTIAAIAAHLDALTRLRLPGQRSRIFQG